MDDFLYFLLIIGWVAFSFYQQSLKKKKKAQQLAAEQNSYDSDETDEMENSYNNGVVSDTSAAGSGRDIKKTLEEILLGGAVSLEDIPEKEAQSLEVIPEQEHFETNEYQKFFESKLKQERETRNDITDDKAIESKEILAEFDEDDDEEMAQRFNLREAIIYSEILYPRYVN